MSSDLLVMATVLGPAAAGAVWLAAATVPWLRRLLGGAVALAVVAAAWAVFWLAFRGEGPAWGGLAPSLLAASMGAFVATAALLVLPRAETLPVRGAAPAIVGLGVGVSAAIYAAFTGSLAALAVLLPIPTLATAAAALSGAGRPDARGLIGLAAADVAALAAIAWLLVEGGSTFIRPLGPAPGVGLLLLAAAAKAGAIPWLATWRVAASDGPGAPVSLVLRAQGVVLAVVAALVVGGGVEAGGHLWAAGAMVLASGVAALWAPSAAGVAASAVGVGAGLLFLALGLGGGVAVRGALLVFPPLLLAAAAVTALATGPPDRERHPAWRWLGATALAAGVASLLGLPAFGSFPGTWLAFSLGLERGETLPYIPVLGAVALGVGLAAVAAVGLLRGLRPGPASVIGGLAAGAVLLYIGAQPIRLAIGWLIRIERELALPELLPTAGAPVLPPLGGWDLLWAGLPGIVVVTALAAAGRSLRDADRPFSPSAALPRFRSPPWLPPPVARLRATVDASRRAAAGYATAAVLEIAALLVAGWTVARGVRLGFL